MSLELIKDLGMLFPTENSKTKKRFGLYKCFCGNEFKTMISSVKNERTKSCGCIHKNMLLNMITKHNLCKHPLYTTWCNIKSRTTNINSDDYINYGARGIDICNEWKNDFLSFYNWALDNGYKYGSTIDRINNDLGYSPENCRWTNRNVQARNKRKLFKSNTSGHKGVTYKNKKWRCTIGVNNKSIHIGMFNTSLEAAKAYDQYVIDNNLEHTRNFN